MERNPIPFKLIDVLHIFSIRKDRSHKESLKVFIIITVGIYTVGPYLTDMKKMMILEKK